MFITILFIFLLVWISSPLYLLTDLQDLLLTAVVDQTEIPLLATPSLYHLMSERWRPSLYTMQSPFL